MDLGISSPQIDEADRGFSFNLDSNLDMRMNQSQKLTASEIINHFDYDELVKILYDYGEEKFAKKIVREIFKYREEKGKISRTTELADIVKKAIPKFDFNNSVRLGNWKSLDSGVCNIPRTILVPSLERTTHSIRLQRPEAAHATFDSSSACWRRRRPFSLHRQHLRKEDRKGNHRT